MSGKKLSFYFTLIFILAASVLLLQPPVFAAQKLGQSVYQKEIAPETYIHVLARRLTQGEIFYVRFSAPRFQQGQKPASKTGGKAGGPLSYQKIKPILIKDRRYKLPLFLNNYEIIPKDRVLYETLLPVSPKRKPGTVPLTLKWFDLVQGKVQKHSFRIKIKSAPFKQYHYKSKITVSKKFTKKKNKKLLAQIRQQWRQIRRALRASKTGERYWQAPFIHPTGTRITSPFYVRRFYNGRPGAPHSGTDFGAAIGHPIRAINHGRVVMADWTFYSGHLTIVDHGHYLYSIYKHQSEILVQKGQWVKKGQIIGKVGETGLVDGAHLHLSVRLYNMYLDPMSLIPEK